MNDEINDVLLEMREILKAISDEQRLLLKEMKELREDQKKLLAEVRLNNHVLGNNSTRNEALN